MLYDICVMGCETYNGIKAKSEDKAKQIALDYFKDDDMWFQTEEAEKASIKDCEIIWKEEE